MHRGDILVQAGSSYNYVKSLGSREVIEKWAKDIDFDSLGINDNYFINLNGDPASERRIAYATYGHVSN